MAHLRCIEGPAEPNLVRLDENDLVAGRSAECGIRLHAPAASRQHWKVCLEGGRWILLDLNSVNGTSLNGRPVRRSVLTEGDKVSAGGAIYVFSEGAPEAEARIPQLDTLRVPALASESPLDSMPVDLGLLVDTVMNLTADCLNGRRWIVALCEGGGLQTVRHRGFDTDPLGDPCAPARRLLEQAVQRGTAVLAVAGEDQRARIAAPIPGGRDPLGGVYMDGGTAYGDDHRAHLENAACRLAEPLGTALRYRDLRERLRQSELELTFTRVAPGAPRRLGDLIGRSAAMEAVFAMIRRVAPTDSAVLIRGETGTGKELVARAIHELSRRASGPFVAENCAAISPALAESELFGHVRGAFTGADRDRAGLFAQADHGTLFLDEIGDMPADLQKKMLRVLQESQVRPVGAVAAAAVDVRLVAATNRPLEDLVQSGAFREDLFYRLNVLPIHVPPLRERPDDIPLLATQFLREAAGAPKELSPDALRGLLRHAWPGNIRELKNVIERLATLSEGPTINGPEVAAVLQAPSSGITSSLDFKRAKGRVVERFEREAILQALVRQRGNIAEVARELDLERRHLYRLLEKFNFKPDDYR